jgi:hypothetical protein
MPNIILMNVVAPWNAPLCRQKQRIYFKTNQGDQMVKISPFGLLFKRPRPIFGEKIWFVEGILGSEGVKCRCFGLSNRVLMKIFWHFLV